ncbi:hypothetical protein DFJ43DRAFT_1158007 [Lentinula guzmanii]|uniref:Uncharacterized protein n=1 Tax=Lentinula guzmanii TaxID=2804957 RepID=A0AA38MWY1_9AGAR|nr:hypothetical protein DFJ43DRAFT_1158007 [Lentinula guzmanii]
MGFVLNPKCIAQPGMFNLGSPQSSRKFIDLIFAASSKWANWDPPKQIHVGDYGTIDKKTGEFEKEGNIYEDVTTAEIATAHPPQTAAKDKTFEISSNHVRRTEFSLEPTASIPGIAEASIKGEWRFSSKRGALLVMNQPRSTYIPPKALLKKLVDVPELKDKYLATETFSCPAYSLYLSSGEDEAVRLALLATVPLPTAVPLSVGGSIQSSWWNQNTSGLFRCASDNEYSYTPLYTLKRIRKPGLLRRDSPLPSTDDDDDLWEDVAQPWDPLDSDGEEQEFEDEVFD